jgi:peptidoglycan/LPS O-acetylase OafA/YrhL
VRLGGLLLYLSGWLLYGHFAVSVFIVISGFCLMLPVVRGPGRIPGGPLAFLGRRARRILPPYYCALAFSLVLIALWIGQKTGTHWDISIPVTWQDVVYNLLLVQDVFAGGKVNHAFWSIAVEWRIYFLFPMFVFLRRRLGPWALALAAIVVPTAFFFTVGQMWFGDFPLLRYGYVGFAASYLALFGLGTLAANLLVSSHARSQALKMRLEGVTNSAFHRLCRSGLSSCSRQTWTAVFCPVKTSSTTRTLNSTLNVRRCRLAPIASPPRGPLVVFV